jgi:hypothetical protein
LRTTIEKITSISAKALGGAKLESFSIAQRMSWAADRRTTRVEDIAYCLLGIFDVNMPLLYGEREKSFLRLQEEIIKKSTDQSIFAWKDTKVAASEYTGLLAPSPHGFKESGNIYSLGVLGRNADLSITNLGTCATFYLDPTTEHNVYGACLDCGIEASLAENPRIWLKRINSMPKQYARVYAGLMSQLGHTRLGGFETVSVRQSHRSAERESTALANVSTFRISYSRRFVCPTAVFPFGSWKIQAQSLQASKAPGKLGAVYYELNTTNCKSRILLILGVHGPGKHWYAGKPWCEVMQVQVRDAETEWLSFESSGVEGSCGGFGSFNAQVNVGNIYNSIVFDVRISIGD